MTAAFEMTLETLSLNRPYYLSEVGLRGKSSLFNSAWMRAPSQTCNGQVGYRLQLLQRPSGESIHRGARNVVDLAFFYL